jgi:hypothetical protein
VRAFFFSIADLWSSSTTFTFTNGGDVLESTDGSLVGTWTDGTTPASVTGTTSTNGEVQGVGLRVRWLADGIVGGRRVVGSTFLTGLNAGKFGTDGLVGAGVVSEVQAAANALITATDGLVYSRERKADPTHVPPIAHRDGTISPIMSAQVTNKVSWLLSRRT